MIYFNGNIKKIIYQNHNISSVYACGGSLVWSGGTTPTGDKFQATYTDGSSYSVPCDGSGKLLAYGEDFTAHTTPISAISTVSIGECIKEIGYGVFKDTSLTSVTFPNSLQTIDMASFAQCNYLTSVNIPNNVTTIGGDAFYYCTRLREINIPSGVTTIGNSTFMNCFQLSSVTIPNDSQLSSIEKYAFKSCRSLTNINIPNTVTSFDDECFMNCSGLTSINIPSGTLIIPDGMMNGCASLTSVTIPSTVYEIHSYAFVDCPNLQYIECLSEFAPRTINQPFDYTTYPIYVLDGSIEDYKTQWGSGYGDRIKPISQKP